MGLIAEHPNLYKSKHSGHYINKSTQGFAKSLNVCYYPYHFPDLIRKLETEKCSLDSE